jgi:hypothetical protein
MLLAAVAAVICFAYHWSFAPQTSHVAAAPPATPGVAIYDPDPKHLWNRVHEALRALIDGAETNDPWELDPFLRRNDEYVFREEAQKTALKVLDEFLAGAGHTLIKDPLKRALLQRDLWTLFDSLSLPRWASARCNPQMELAVRLARIIPRLGLTAEEIKKLPDNYGEAVAAKLAWNLPTDLWDPKGPWVLLGDAAQLPLALSHVHFFGGRSTFFVFLRLPEGREQTLQLLDNLRKRVPTAALLQLPSGSRLALVRQMQLIDSRGKPVATNITESLQLRGQGCFEFKLSRQDLLARKPSLKVVGEDDRERGYLLFMGNNAGQGPGKVLGSCFHCHQGKGIESVLSYQRFTPLPRTPRAKPELIATSREEVENWSWGWTANRYEWGLLQGLTQINTRD